MDSSEVARVFQTKKQQFQNASCSSFLPSPLSGTLASRLFKSLMASEHHLLEPPIVCNPLSSPHLPPPAALATSLQTPDHWQQSPATSMETD